MHTEKIKMHAVIEEFDEKGRRYWREEDRVEELTMLHDDRQHIFCNMCGAPDYPDCLKRCSVGWDDQNKK